MTGPRRKPWPFFSLGNLASGSRFASLECKGEKGRAAEKGERDDVVPRQLLLQEQNRKDDEDDQRDDLLNDFQLKSGKLAVTETIRRHRQAIFEQGNSPRDQDRLPKRPVVAILQVAIPGEGHEYVR